MTNRHKLKRTILLLAAASAITLGTGITLIALNSPNTATRAQAPEYRYKAFTKSTHQGPPVLTEFGDFQCPYCARFAIAVLPTIHQEFIEPGHLKFQFRHFPVLGPQSYLAAQASECARDQGQFQQFHDSMYFNLANNKRPTTSNLKETARLLGMNQPEFHKCLTDAVHEGTVQQDKEYGRSLGVRGTPTLFINHRPVEWTSIEDLTNQIKHTVNSQSPDTSELPQTQPLP